MVNLFYPTVTILSILKEKYLRTYEEKYRDKYRDIYGEYHGLNGDFERNYSIYFTVKLPIVRCLNSP